MHTVGRAARDASREIARAETRAKDIALDEMAAAIERDSTRLLEANGKDVEAAKRKGLEPAMVDRLGLDQKGIATMADGLRQIARLPDPVGEISEMRYRPSGIQVGRMRVPLGVIGIIYESRPNVTADAAGLCLKAGNAAILRGGSEAIHSNQAIGSCVHEGLRAAGLPAEAVQVIETTDRAAVGELITMSEHVDIIVPRGGKGLIERVSTESRIPVLKHLDGVCHVYIDNRADLDKAIRIADNAKTQRYGTCNTLETLLVHKEIAPDVLPRLAAIYLEKGVELRGDDVARALVPEMMLASEEDWFAEYLAAILAIRVVDDMDQAIDHITKYGSQHTDTIVTEDWTKARRFLREVDSPVSSGSRFEFRDGQCINSICRWL